MFTKLSILGLYNYDPAIFDGLLLPDGMDKETTVDSILTECAELSLVYTDPETVKNLISIWSRKQREVWQKLYSSTQLEYNPIHNYDRTEEWVDDETGSAQASGENTEQVQGFNNGDFTDRSKNTSTTNANSTRKNTRLGRAYGNIGVTTTQQMLDAERKTALYNVIDVIVSEFKARFCIMVY